MKKVAVSKNPKAGPFDVEKETLDSLLNFLQEIIADFDRILKHFEINNKTPNCQSDPEWNPKTKLKTQGLLAGSLHKILLLNHRKKTWLTVRRVWILINFRVYFKNFL